MGAQLTAVESVVMIYTDTTLSREIYRSQIFQDPRLPDYRQLDVAWLCLSRMGCWTGLYFEKANCSN